MLVARSRLERRQAIIQIGVHRFDPDSPAPQVALNTYRALIDTGATRTCLTYYAVSNEGLIRHGRKRVKNVHNENLHGLYMARLGIFATDERDGERLHPVVSYFALDEPVEVMDIADNDRFDAILGMDVLQRYDFNFHREGDFELRLTL